jgi:hypothetical protein
MKKPITEYFRRDVDGTWTCIESTTLDHPSGRIQFSAGTAFRTEDTFMGVKVAQWLDLLSDARRTH